MVRHFGGPTYRDADTFVHYGVQSQDKSFRRKLDQVLEVLSLQIILLVVRHIGGPASRKHYKDEGDGAGSKLEFFQHAEGRVVIDGSSFDYEYNLTDHLGNVRVTLDQSRTAVQKDDYYPFGLTFNSWTDVIPENQYKFNGKEEQQEWGVIDYGARMYMADIGRWGVADPLSEGYLDLSPYNFH